VEFDSVYRFSNVPANLQLPYNINNLTFHFSALDWSAPHHLRYSYLLEGFNEDWSIPDKAAQANFPKLPYGAYSLRVRALGENNQWSDTLSYSFVIKPPWWFTFWAKSFYTVMFLLVMMSLVRLRTRNLKIRSRKLEVRVIERTKELKQSQSQLVQSTKMASLGQLTAGIAHEINNPVSFTQTSSFALDRDMEDITNLIKKYRSYIQKLKQDKSEIEEFEKNIDYEVLMQSINQEIADIKEGTLRTAEIVKNLREFSYEDHEEMELADIHQGIETTLNILKSRFTTQISLTKNYDQSIGEIKCHIGQLNQVFLNVLSNALDAIEEKGEIVITTKNQETSLLVSIKDDGKGIPEEIINKIFDPFFTTKKIGDGTGLGLSISHGIIKNHGGTISVISNTEKKTCFNIKLPIIK
jgi:signal transduction histidine kinase